MANQSSVKIQLKTLIILFQLTFLCVSLNWTSWLTASPVIGPPFWQVINFVLTFSERRERTPGKVWKHLWCEQRKFSNSARGRGTLKSIEASTIVYKSLPTADTLVLLQWVFLLYVVWNNCICSLLLDWRTLFVQHVYCFSSWGQPHNHPFLRRLNRINLCEGFWRKSYTLPQTLYLSLSLKNCRKIPKISPGAYIFQRPFLRGLVLEGLILGGAYLWREICASKSN